MKKVFDYTNVGKEIGWDFKKMKYEVETLTRFDFWNEVKRSIKNGCTLLDLGCGSAQKTILYANEKAKEIYLADSENEMLKKAKDNIKKICEEQNKNKFHLEMVDCRGKLPFPNEFFDVVIARHSCEASSEVYRVLKKCGVFISEDIANDDCQELKELFGRGQCYNQQDTRSKIFENYRLLGFEKIYYSDIIQKEYYFDKENLLYLIEHTPILEYYDRDKDDNILNQYIKTYSTKKGILLNRKLYGFYLVK